MKKTLLLLTGLLFINLSIGQDIPGLEILYKVKAIGEENPIPEIRPTTIQNRAAGDIIISDDFSNSSNWLNSLDANGYQFEILSTTPTDMINFMGTMVSTTNNNGFAVFNGITLLLNAATTPFGTQNAVLEYNAPINCSGLSSVLLEFEQRYRRFNSDSCFVEVSNDNFATYQTWHLNDDFTIGGNVMQETEVVNISAVAGNQSNVSIRFRWKGGDDQTFGAGYGWFIDDFKLIEGAHYDAKIETASFNSNGLEYYMVPTSQLTGIEMVGEVHNNGDSVHTGLHLVGTADFGGNVFTGTSTSVDLPPGVTDTMETTTLFTPTSGIGTYDLTWTFLGNNPDDIASGNDTLTDSIQVTPALYSRDNNIETGTINNFASNSGLEFKIGNVMETFNHGYMNALNIKVSSNVSNIGQLIYGEVYQLVGANYVLVAITPDYEITASDLDTFIRFQLPIPVEVDAGDNYLICAAHYGGTPEVEFCMAQPTYLSSVFGFDATGQLALLLNPRAIMIRAEVTQDVTLTQEITICEGDSYSVGNSTYTISGIYTDSLTTFDGNDSIVNTTLTVLQPYNDTVNVNICNGESYTVGGSTYFNAGTYTDSLTMVNYGCDSIITTNLSVASPINTLVSANQFTLFAILSNATYQWVDCDNGNQLIPGATLQSFAPQINGNYAVQITFNGCTEQSICHQIEGLDISEYEELEFSIYPNPVQNSFFIKIEAEMVNNCQFKIRNSVGQIVWDNEVISSVHYKVDGLNLANGIYYVEMISDQKSSIKKLLIQN